MKVRGPILPHQGPGEAASVPEQKGCISGGTRLPLGLGEPARDRALGIQQRWEGRGGDGAVRGGEDFLEVGPWRGSWSRLSFGKGETDAHLWGTWSLGS